MNASTASFKAMRGQVLSKWQAMGLRERQMITLAAWLLGLTLLVLLGVRPAVRTLQQAPVQLSEVNATLDDMRRQAEEVKALRQLPAVPPAQAQAALQTATERLGPSAVLSVQADRVVVKLIKVPGGQLAEWLNEVRSSARARPLEANIAETEPGAYSGSITLALTASALNR
jgi:general secretion pathway protein M